MAVDIHRDPGRRRAWVLEAEQWLPLPPEQLWPFFADAHNLEAITPPWLNFHVITPDPIPMREGTIIDYRLRLHGVPVRWRSRIAAWRPPHCFVDQQVRGPYKRWHHTHTFEPERGGTRCRDRVEYELPGGPLSPLIHRLIVERDVRTIFRYRERVLAERFGEARADEPPARRRSA